MLNKLFGSELRVKVLKRILAHPDEKYFSRSLGRELKVLPAALKRELDNLEKLGLIAFAIEEEEKKAKGKEKKFFLVNQGFLLFSELKALLAKSQLFAVQEFFVRLEKIAPIKYFVLSGRFSGNTLAKTDILIVSKIKKEKLLSVLADLEKKIGREVNFTLMDEIEFDYRSDVMDIFLYTILNGPKVVLLDNLSDREKAKKREESVKEKVDSKDIEKEGKKASK